MDFDVITLSDKNFTRQPKLRIPSIPPTIWITLFWSIFFHSGVGMVILSGIQSEIPSIILGSGSGSLM